MMVTLTIDGRRVSMEPGTTVLQAAQWLGIRIPTMCHVPGMKAPLSIGKSIENSEPFNDLASLRRH